MSHHGRTPKKTGLSPAQCPSLWHGPTTISAARRVRPESPNAVPHLQRQRAPACLRRVTRGACLALKTTSYTSYHERARKERGLPPAQCTSIGMGRSQPVRHGARAVASRVLRLLPRDSKRRAQARLRRVARGACFALELAVGTSHHERTPKERSLSPAQCPLSRHGQTTASAAQRAHAKSLSAAPPPQRQRVKVRLRRARHATLAWRCRPQLARRATGARRKKQASRRRGALPCGISRSQPAQHGARAQQARIMRLFSRDSEHRRACA